MPTPDAHPIPRERFDPGRALRSAELLALLVAAVAALLFHATLTFRIPDEEDRIAAVRFIRENWREGDAVLLHPWWTERSRTLFPAGTPVLGHLGIDAGTLTRHRRIWVLSQPRLPGSGSDAAPMPTTATKQSALTRDFGSFSVEPFENAAVHEQRFSAAAMFDTAAVALMAGQDRTPCVPSAGGFDCHTASRAFRVARGVHDLRYEPRTCILAPPPGGALRTAVEFSDVPGNVERWSLEAGIIWEHAFAHDAELTATTVSAFLDDGGPPLELTIVPGMEGMRSVSRSSAGARRSPRVIVEVSSTNPHRRELCFDLVGTGADP